VPEQNGQLVQAFALGHPHKFLLKYFADRHKGDARNLGHGPGRQHQRRQNDVIIPAKTAHRQQGRTKPARPLDEQELQQKGGKKAGDGHAHNRGNDDAQRPVGTPSPGGQNAQRHPDGRRQKKGNRQQAKALQQQIRHNLRYGGGQPGDDSGGGHAQIALKQAQQIGHGFGPGHRNGLAQICAAGHIQPQLAQVDDAQQNQRPKSQALADKRQCAQQAAPPTCHRHQAAGRFFRRFGGDGLALAVVVWGSGKVFRPRVFGPLPRPRQPRVIGVKRLHLFQGGFDGVGVFCHAGQIQPGLLVGGRQSHHLMKASSGRGLFTRFGVGNTLPK